jgi:NAD(P)-dependent dehydrogenase (short-subunit alcohol dehydrogenase family)
MTDRQPVAIVTGGSRGIGFEICRRLVQQGWSVCLTGRKADVLEKATVKLSGSGGDVEGVAGSAQDVEHQQAVVDRVLNRWGHLDVLVNNAAASPFYGPLVEAEPARFQRALEVNVLAPWSWARLAWDRHMGEHGGAIVNIGSIGGLYPIPRVGLYNVSKAALLHLTKQLAMELAPGVRVNAVVPATIKTDFSRAKYENREDEVAASFPLRRLGTADEVAAMVVLLCTDPAFDWVTGQMIVMDGGGSLHQGVR